MESDRLGTYHEPSEVIRYTSFTSRSADCGRGRGALQVCLWEFLVPLFVTLLGDLIDAVEFQNGMVAIIDAEVMIESGVSGA